MLSTESGANGRPHCAGCVGVDGVGIESRGRYGFTSELITAGVYEIKFREYYPNTNYTVLLTPRYTAGVMLPSLTFHVLILDVESFAAKFRTIHGVMQNIGFSFSVW